MAAHGTPPQERRQTRVREQPVGVEGRPVVVGAVGVGENDVMDFPCLVQ